MMQQDRSGGRDCWKRWLKERALSGWPCLLAGTLVVLATGSCYGQVLYETESKYQRIRVVEQGGFRLLNFDGARETRMSVRNPLRGHFEYIEYFHMPWLWNANIQQALMIGLGGGSIQRQYLHYYPQVSIDSVEIDPKVVEVAKKYFNVPENEQHQIHVRDGRAFLENTQKNYDVIIMDAYGGDAAGDSIPYRLATREFFQAAMGKLNTNGVIAYNVMGTLTGWRAELLGTIYRTMSSVFPQVYLFPARSSRNVVLLGTRDARFFNLVALQSRASRLIRSGNTAFANFRPRLLNFRVGLPPAAPTSPVLTDQMVAAAEGNPIQNQSSGSEASAPTEGQEEPAREEVPGSQSEDNGENEGENEAKEQGVQEEPEAGTEKESEEGAEPDRGESGEADAGRDSESEGKSESKDEHDSNGDDESTT